MRIFLTVCLAILLAIVGVQAQTLPQWADSWNGVHGFLVFGPRFGSSAYTTCEQVAADAYRYDFGWGAGCFPELAAAHPGYKASVYVDGTQGGQVLSFYQMNHPDWILYNPPPNTTRPLIQYGYDYSPPVGATCATYPYTYGPNSSAVVPDFSNQAERDYRWTNEIQFYAQTTQGGTLGFDNALISNDHTPVPCEPNYGHAYGNYPNATPGNLNGGGFVQKYAGRGSYADVFDPQYTSAYIAWMADITGRMHQMSPPRLALWNTNPQIIYNDSGRRTALINALDGILVEGGNLGPEWVGDSRKIWLGQIKFIEDMNAAGKAVYVEQQAIAYTTLAAIPQSWIRFTLASYLLAKGRHAGVAILPNAAYDRGGQFWPAEFDAANGGVGVGNAIGVQVPCGPMAQVTGPAGSEDGIFRREYSGGVAAANGSLTNNYALTLPAGPWTYRDLYNNVVTSPINMLPDTGNVFLKTGVASDLTCSTGSTDTTPPTLVTGPNVAPITTTTARIVGTTNEPADWRIDFGLTASYGAPGSPVLDPTFTLGQDVTISGLTPGTTYHYRVTFHDSSGNAGTSTDSTFTTSPLATLTITTSSLVPGTIMTAYSDQVSATGGTPGAGFARVVAVTLPRPAADLANFPHWICKTLPEWKTIAFGGLVQSDLAFDFVWYSNAALATRLDSRLDFVKYRYVASTGEWCGYVRLPAFAASADLTIYAAYGSGTVTTDQGNAAAVFSPMGGHIAGHWPLDTLADSTLNPSDLTVSSTPPSFALAKVNLGLTFGISQWAQTNAAAKLTQTGPMTLCLWANYTDALTTALLTTGGNGGNFGMYAGDTLASRPKFFVTQGGVLKAATSSVARNTSSDVFLCGGYTGSNVVLYVNGGAEIVTGTALTGALDADPLSNVVFGQVASHGASWCTSCKVDEVTLYDQWMGAPWIAARYAAENTPGAVSIGTPIAAGGGGYVWSVVTGTLPAGLTLSGSVISGTPTTAGTSNFTMRVSDGTVTADKPLSITINAPVSITETTLPNGVIGQGYNQSLTAAGGTTPFNLTLVAGTLPTGAILTPTALKTQGTNVLTAPGFYVFTVRATDAVGATSDQRYSMFVASATGISYSPLAIYWNFTSGNVAVKYSYDCITYTTVRAGLAFGATPYTAQLPQSDTLCLTLDSSTEADVTAPAIRVSGEYLK